jgi:hypothetical protein
VTGSRSRASSAHDHLTYVSSTKPSTPGDAPAGFIQNLRRGYYELGVDEPVALRVADFDELALAI